MKIDYAVLCAKNLERTRESFEKHFGEESGNKYHEEKTDFQPSFLTFGDSAKLEIMHNSILE